MDFHETLKTIRINRGVTQKSLSLSLGVTPVTVGNWERGVRQPSFGLLVRLADTLNTSTDELLGRSGAVAEPARDAVAGTLVKKYRALDAHGRKLVDTVCAMEYERMNHGAGVIRTPVYGNGRQTSRNRYIPRYLSPPAAGFGVPLEGDDFEMIRVDDSVPDDADYAVCISGDSMEPYILDGEMVFVKETAKLNIGDIGIFSVNGEMYCKQYYVDGERNLHLLSANPERADASVHVSHDGGCAVHCCGKVLLDISVPLPDYIRG